MAMAATKENRKTILIGITFYFSEFLQRFCSKRAMVGKHRGYIAIRSYTWMILPSHYLRLMAFLRKKKHLTDHTHLFCNFNYGFLYSDLSISQDIKHHIY